MIGLPLLVPRLLVNDGTSPQLTLENRSSAPNYGVGPDVADSVDQGIVITTDLSSFDTRTVTADVNVHFTHRAISGLSTRDGTPLVSCRAETSCKALSEEAVQLNLQIYDANRLTKTIDRSIDFGSLVSTSNFETLLSIPVEGNPALFPDDQYATILAPRVLSEMVALPTMVHYAYDASQVAGPSTDTTFGDWSWGSERGVALLIQRPVPWIVLLYLMGGLLPGLVFLILTVFHLSSPKGSRRDFFIAVAGLLLATYGMRPILAPSVSWPTRLDLMLDLNLVLGILAAAGVLAWTRFLISKTGNGSGGGEAAGNGAAAKT